MAQITAQMVKELREMTGAGMMECKKALTEADGDVNAAVDVLRERGIVKAAAKAGRATTEGTVAVFVCKNCGHTGVVEVACETDFVSATEPFKEFADSVAKTIAHKSVKDLETLMTTELEESGQTVEATLTEKIHTIGENMTIPRIGYMEFAEGVTGHFERYIHMGGKVGVAVQFVFDKAETAENETFKTYAHDVALQVAASDPVSVRREEVDQAIIDHEMKIYRAQAAESGKPAEIQEKMAEGKLNKYFKEACLLEQVFIKDADLTIEKLTENTNKAVGDTIQIVDFIRFKVGETAAATSEEE